MASEQQEGTVTFTIPVELGQRIEKEAADRGISVEELLRQMLGSYRADWMKELLAETAAYVKTLPPTPYTEEDVPRLVKEIRAERAEARHD